MPPFTAPPRSKPPAPKGQSLALRSCHLKRKTGGRHIGLALLVLCLSGCFWDQKKVPPPSPVNRLPPHESWCYETLGYNECYTTPQRSQASRLINVDPQSRYPLSRQDYNKAVSEKGP